MSNNFVKKFQVSKIYSGLKNTSETVISNEYDKVETVKLSELHLVSEEDICKLISSAASKSCVLDCIPTWFLKDNSSVFVPIITCISNRSLSTGTFSTL